MQRFACLLLVCTVLAGSVAGKKEQKKRDLDRPDLPNCALAHKMFKADKKMGLYKCLGLKHSASDKKIKKNWRAMQLKCHPDRHQTDPKANEKAASVNEAYSILSEKRERNKYNQNGYRREGMENGGGGGGGRGGNPFGGGGGGGGSPFGNMFGGGGGGGGGNRFSHSRDGRRGGGGGGGGFPGGGGGGPPKPSKASKDLRAFLILYYKQAGVQKSDDQVKKMAMKYATKPSELYPKLTEKYTVDAVKLKEDIKMLGKTLSRHFSKLKVKKSADDINKLSRKYATNPGELYAKLLDKYGVIVKPYVKK